MDTIQLEARVCPLCNRSDAGKLFAEASVDPAKLGEFAFASRKLPEYMHWRLAECRRCDLLYADPAPAPESLASLYRDAAFDSGEQARLASRSYGRFLPEIARNLPDLVGAADIGTGDGAFLHELIAAGFTEVRGVEPSSAPIAQADEAVRPLILHEMFRPGTFPAGSLSLVSCFQTIEHLSDVLGFCRAAFDALKPGGALYLIGHNRRSMSAKALGRKSPIFDIEHLQLFSPASLRTLLTNAGFDRISVRPIFNSYPLHYWARLFPFPPRFKGRMLDHLGTSPAGRWIIPLPAGNLAAVAYKAA